jgi:heme-degrading monooxygenase HmoA
MYIAMNRFKISLGLEAAFEKVWRDRDSHLLKVPGFKKFNLIKGDRLEDHTLYASHSIWASKEHFINWTKSEAFRQAHKGAGENRDMYLGHPVFEGFEVVQ